ncbi:MAG TPA: SURF1 family cytochrome oxidase biogenesis protein, partial [Caulobacteraceae bacterium]|nr:SURF1 family cytochrome oxidase biogenesis protein [Caulobacteraceae bacterium]
MPSERFRFPVGLTLAALAGVAILCGLGVWQVQRLAWKTQLLARIDALQKAPAQPLGPVLERARRGEDVDFTRVAFACAPSAAPARRVFLYAVNAGAIAWRPVSPCRIAAGGYDRIAVDRGVIAGGDAMTGPPALDVAP